MVTFSAILAILPALFVGLNLLKILLLLAAVITAIMWFLRRVWFYRDPVRVPPTEAGTILAPADGKVVYIKPFRNGEVVAEKLGQAIPVREIMKAPGLGDRGWIMGIYMSPLDVHFNYAPIAGRVEDMVHTRARVNLPMVDLWEYIRLTYFRRAVDLFCHRYRLVNERLTIFLDGEGIKIAMVEIADKFVNKINSFIKPGQVVDRGQKVSFIERGSQVDLVIFSEDVEFTVRVGQQVYGARTVVARYRPPGGVLP
ncbi:phosphatidylserine decarboxylase [Moorella thermoacetica Y72]|uniref:Phosphatidylserine decarboxylase n=1 Tax=Moorella thermoacetica Y72 TaxID=1325331 RepID=A0A0S6UGJ7_NEOTH|nr:phosphatidylserine decarboxylase [Moorella thermoacetica]GAF26139.1 phosphatidylserine decarboxylase [Moorella thermoacetica Y72]